MAFKSFFLLVMYSSIFPTHCVQSLRDGDEGAVKLSDAPSARTTMEVLDQDRRMMHSSVPVGANGAMPPIQVMRRQQPVFDKKTLAQGFDVQSEHSNSHKLAQDLRLSEQELETLSDEAITGGQGVNDSDIESVIPTYRFIVVPTLHGGILGTTRVRLPQDLMLYVACFTTMGLMGVFVVITILNCGAPPKEDLTVGGNFQPMHLKSIPVQVARPVETKH